MHTSTVNTPVLHNATGLCPPLGHYSHISIAHGFVHVSGQLPVDEHGQPQTALPFEDQVHLVLRNLDRCLATAGVGREQLVQVRVYVTNIAQWADFDAIYAQWAGEHRPARAVAGVKELHYNAAVEVEALALSTPA